MPASHGNALAGRTAIVTGGGWNIGRAIALRYAAEGARVVLAGRRPERLAETARLVAEQGGVALCVPCDVTKAAEVEGVARAALERFGSIDTLAAIAGGGGRAGEVDEVDPREWAEVLAVNVLGTYHAVRAVVPAMRSAGRGTIVTCTGGGAFFPVVGEPCSAYATAKAAVCRLTDQLAVELLGAGIRVNCLQPGMTWDAERLERVCAEEGRTGVRDAARGANHAPEESAEIALWLASDASAPLTGRVVATDDVWWRDPERVQAVAQSFHAFMLRRVEGA